jgi:methyltransferase (TIGR00027 family)
MLEWQASRTALRVALRRAAHQILDSPTVLDDPLAVRIVGREAVDALRNGSRRQSGPSRSLRAFVSVRSRLAEDELRAAVARGVRQYVVLGAGLDTFAYRNPFDAQGLRVFEVDHPATQAWKQNRLAEAGIAMPSSLTFAPVNFEQQTLADGLERAGFDRRRPAFFSWLGVSMYLTDAAIDATLAFVASCPAGSGIAFDYSIRRSELSILQRFAHDAVARRVAAAGEPFVTAFEPQALGPRLRRMGFSAVHDFDQDEINARYFKDHPQGLRVRGGLVRIVVAWVQGERP